MEGTTTTGGGEIVQADRSGHIFRPTCRKDRHSKVYTERGPKDRRVRLSAHTAIQFYDVQDRLGYDRPSKAVDWLIKKAKTAIDKINAPPPPPPPWLPSPHDSSNPSSDPPSSESPLVQCINSNNINPNCGNFSFEEPDLAKSFFPTSNFTGFSSDSASRESFRDLGLSLQSLQAADDSINQGNSDGQMPPFQESFQYHVDSGRVGFLMHSVENSQRPVIMDDGLSCSYRELLQSSLTVNNNPWNQTDGHNPQRKSSDFESPFELGFRVPARISGDGEPENRC